MKYKHLRKRTVFQNKHLKIFQEELLLPRGQKVCWSFFQGMSAAAVIAVTEEDELILVKQYRPAIKEHTLEIPAGLIEKGEDPEIGAKRELEEETGYRAGKLTKIYEYYTSPGISASKMYIYMATDLVETEQKLDDDEFLDIVDIGLGTAMKWINTGKIKDSKTIIGILMAWNFLNDG